MTDRRTTIGRGTILALLLLRLLAPPAPAGAHQESGPSLPAPSLPVPGPREAFAALDRWDLAAARRILEGAPAAFGSWGGVLRSSLAFHEGRYEEALRLLRALPPDVRHDAALAEYTGRAEATLEMHRSLRPRESEHFVLWSDPERDWVLVEPAFEVLERSYRESGAWLGDFPREKIRVEIVSSAEAFARVSSLTREEIETSGAIGICKFNKIMVLSPRLLARGYRWRDALAHEYLHFLQVRLSANRAPIWLQEGVARYGESLWRSPEPSFLEELDRGLIARALREDALVGFGAMDPSLVRLPSMGAVRLAFAECALAVEYLLRHWRIEGLRGVFAELARGEEYRGMDPVLQAALGVSLERFEAEWRADLAGRGFQETPGAVVPALRLAAAGGQAAEEADLEEWHPVAAQNHLRLGDLLRARGNKRAALIEYERARKISAASPLVHVKIARTLLQLERPEPAAAAAREAVRAGEDYATAHVTLAAALAALADWRGAEAALAEALEINPFDPTVWRDVGAVLRRLGREEEALPALQTALRLDPSDVETHRLIRGGR